MKKILFFICLFVSPVGAIEKVTLNSPLVIDPRQTSTVQINYLVLDWESKTVRVGIGSNGIDKEFQYSGGVAIGLLTSLNKANLASNSLHKRILNQLIADGYISGTINGNPD